MPLTDTTIAEIDAARLQRLVEERISEGKTIDFKRDGVGTNDRARKEFLADVSSFANSSGGHLVYGIAERGGAAHHLAGLEGIDPDQEVTRLDSMVRDGIQPRNHGNRYSRHPPGNRLARDSCSHPKELESTASSLPTHTPLLWAWFQRKYLLDVDELRTIFASSETIAERTRTFRIGRVAQIVAGELR